MKNNIHYIVCFLSLMMFIDCEFTSEEKTLGKSNDESHSNNVENNIIRNDLYEIITGFINEQDSILKDYHKWPICMIIFSSSDKEYTIDMVSTLIYDKEDFYGYLMIEEKMIAFYVKNNHNNVNFHNVFVDIDFLLEEPPSQFIHWKQDDNYPPIPPFNAKYRKYKVLEDELVYVESGIW